VTTYYVAWYYYISAFATRQEHDETTTNLKFVMDEENEAGGVVSADEVNLYNAPGDFTVLRDVEWNNTVLFEIGEEHPLSSPRRL